jgi:hypothetical protein
VRWENAMSLRDDCKDFISERLGRKVSDKQADDIEKRVKAQMKLLAMRNPGEWRQLGYFDRVQRAATEAAKEMAEEFRRKQFVVQKQIEAHDRIENILAAAKTEEPTGAAKLLRFLRNDSLSAVSRLLDYDTRGGEYTSVQSWAHAVKAEMYGQLMPAWDAAPGRFFGLFENHQGAMDLWKELHGEDSGNATAKAGAAAFHQVAEQARQRFNDAGGAVGKLEDWGIPQHHGQERVAKAGIDKWTGDILPRLDRDRYLNTDGSRMADRQMHDFLMHAYDSIITDGQNSKEPGNVAGIGMIANRNAAERALHFKDAQAHAEYNTLYGERSLMGVLQDHISRMARDIALIERLGPNAEQTFKYFNDRAFQDEARSNPERITQVKSDHVFNQALFDAVSGRDKVVNQNVANRFQAFRNWMTATRLGKVVITALGDEAGMASTSFANRVPYTDTLMRELKTLNPTDSTARRAAQTAGLGLDAMASHMNRFGQEEFGQSVSGKLAGKVMQVSGAERMWEARRQGLGTVLMSSIGNLTRQFEHIEQLSAEDHGVITQKGVTDDTWQIWRKAETEDWGQGAHSVLTPKSIWSIPDAKIDEVIAPRIQKVRAEAQRQVDELNARDQKEREQLTKRADDLSTWLKDEMSRFSGRANKGLIFELKDLEQRMSRLQEGLEYARSYWKAPIDENTPGIQGEQPVSFYGKTKLRGLGVDEGRAREAIDSIKAESRAIGAEIRQRKADLQEKMYQGFFERQAQLKEFTDQAERRMERRQQVVDRIQRDIEPQIQTARLNARREASTQLLAHVLEEAGMGAMDAGPRQRISTNLGSARGTFSGELWRSMNLFRSFAFSMMMKHWSRAAQMDGVGRAKYLAPLVLYSTLISAAGNQVRNFLAGQNPDSMGDLAFWGRALLRGGGLGFFGDFLSNEVTQHDTSLAAALGGPAATTAEDILSMTHGAFFKSRRGEQTDEAAKLVRFARENVPFTNLWYTQAAFDHLLWNHMQEAASPGYLERMESRQQKLYGHTYWWHPADALPSEAPNPTTMFASRR